MREAQVCKFLIVDHARALLECYLWFKPVVRIGFGIAALLPFPKAYAMFSCYSAS